MYCSTYNTLSCNMTENDFSTRRSLDMCYCTSIKHEYPLMGHSYIILTVTAPAGRVVCCSIIIIWLVYHAQIVVKIISTSIQVKLFVSFHQLNYTPYQTILIIYTVNGTNICNTPSPYFIHPKTVE